MRGRSSSEHLYLDEVVSAQLSLSLSQKKKKKTKKQKKNHQPNKDQGKLLAVFPL